MQRGPPGELHNHEEMLAYLTDMRRAEERIIHGRHDPPG